MKRVTLDNKYEIGGGVGSWAKSRENGVNKGDVRVIGGILMYAYTVYGSFFWPNEVNWCPVDRKLNDFSDLAKWANSL